MFWCNGALKGGLIMMKWSEYFLPTLKDAPSDAESISHKLMLRAGLVKKLSSGIYSYLPCGLKVLQKVQNIVREKMNEIGCQEILMPAIHPIELWHESKRWEHFEQTLFRLNDTRGVTPFVLGATHEVVITDIARSEFHSYKDLPKTLYQIQTKFRNEPRPRFGLIRSREFIMMDAYSFHRNEEDLNKTYSTVYNAHKRIFEKCAIDVIIIEADSGPFGDGISHEFMVLSNYGEDKILICNFCSHCADTKKHQIKERTPLCIKCGKELSVQSAIELDHIFKLGTTYSVPLKAMFLDEDGSYKPLVMGCYGIGISRLLSAILEKHNDKDGICWPFSVAPFDVVITQIDVQDKQTEQRTTDLYNKLVSKGMDVLIDDRDKRPGVKFKDADLVGFPIRIVLGEKAVKENKAEVFNRKTKTVKLMGIEEAVSQISELKKGYQDDGESNNNQRTKSNN